MEKAGACFCRQPPLRVLYRGAGCTATRETPKCAINLQSELFDFKARLLGRFCLLGIRDFPS